MKRVGAIFLFAAIGARAQIADASCDKWSADLSICDVYPNSEDCYGDEELTWGQESYYWRLNYRDTAYDACVNSWKYHPTAWMFPKKVEVTSDPEIMSCCVKWWNTTWLCDSDVGLENVGEPECDLTPAGPYTNANRAHPRPAVTRTPGGKFSYDQRVWVLDEQMLQTGLSYPISDYPNDFPAEVKRFTFPPYEDDPGDADIQVSDGWDDSIQIDHILPRIDKYGCPCGGNGYNNMLPISGTLNRTMSNNMNDPDRIALLVQYLPGYLPPKVAESDEANRGAPDADASSDEIPEALAGCSTSSRPSWFALGALALMIARRRRRY